MDLVSPVISTDLPALSLVLPMVRLNLWCVRLLGCSSHVQVCSLDLVTVEMIISWKLASTAGQFLFLPFAWKFCCEASLLPVN